MIKENTRIINITVYKHQLNALDRIVNIGYSNSRSQLIRKIIDTYVTDYIHELIRLNLFILPFEFLNLLFFY